jgi:hypothetical protein
MKTKTRKNLLIVAGLAAVALIWAWIPGVLILLGVTLIGVMVGVALMGVVSPDARHTIMSVARLAVSNVRKGLK